MSRRLTRAAIVGAVLLGLGASGIVCQRVAARGRYAIPYSSYGAGPEGQKALFLFAERAGLSPVRWAQDLTGLPERALLVAAGGCEQATSRGLSRYEREELVRFVEGGGTLLVAGTSEYLFEELGVTLRPSSECEPSGSLAAALARAERGEDGADDELRGLLESDPIGAMAQLTEEPSFTIFYADGHGVLDGLSEVPLRSPGIISVEGGAPGGADTDSEILLSAGKPPVPVGVVRRRGEGHVIVLASASLFQNEGVLAADGAAVFARLAAAYAPRGPVLFDEYHLGVGERRSLARYVRDIGAIPFVLQLLIIVGFVIFGLGVRFGRPQTEVREPPMGTASFVSGIGSLYARAGDAAGALALLSRHGLDAIARHHHAPSAEPAALVSFLRERDRGDVVDAVGRLGVLAGTGAGALSGAPKTKLLAGQREIDSLVEHATSERREEP